MAAAPIDYDALAAQHGGTPAVDYDALAAQHGGTAVGSGQSTDTRFGFQKSFDANTQTSPNEPMLETGLKDVVHAIGQPFVHPWETIKGIASSPSVTDPYGMAGAAMPTVQAYQDAGGGAHGAAYAGTKLAAQAFGNAALGEAAGAGVGAARAVAPEATSTAISAAKSVAGKIVPSLVDGPPESLMTRAIKPGKNNVNWNTDVQKAVPLMKSAEEQLGRPIQGVDDALAAADLAKKQVWQQYQARLGPAAQRGAVIDGNQIAEAMVNSIDKRTAMQNPDLVARVKATADTYRRPLSLNDAEDFLQSANKDLNSYYAKNKVGQQVALNDPEMSSTVAEAGALRNALYSKLDQLTGPGAAQLKQAYGALSNVEKELYGRQLVAARQNPESLTEQLSSIKGGAQIAKGLFTANPGDVLEGAQNVALSKAIKARNTSDAMITRAFQKAPQATPFPMPKAAIPIAGALPATTGGPIELPYVPEMSSGERIAALQQLLRQSQPLALPAQATPIRLPPPQ